MAKIRVGLVFGGKSSEHEVSVRSAASIYQALDKNKFDVELLGIDKKGEWHKMDQKWLPTGTAMKSLPSGEKALNPQEETVDVFFPIIHGTYGEDGCLQGLFELLNVAYVGAGVLGSAVGMDKEVMKRLLVQAKIPVARWMSVKKPEISDELLQTIANKLKYPIFVKPANLGSSVGISKAHDFPELKKAAGLAGLFDIKILFEECIRGREIEISVIGNKTPLASVPGEVIPGGAHEFYDYEAKYTDENGAELIIPAKLSKKKIREIQNLAIRTYKILECSGMARVDMFIKPGGKIIINEINTIPGFTDISMYPKLWAASGLPYTELLDRLIKLALERKKEKDELKRSFDRV
jgi:D-alanine-D-alanine ligase